MKSKKQFSTIYRNQPERCDPFRISDLKVKTNKTAASGMFYTLSKTITSKKASTPFLPDPVSDLFAHSKAHNYMGSPLSRALAEVLSKLVRAMGGYLARFFQA